MYKYLDFVHIMCYDYHGKWDRKTGHNAPLYARPEEKGQDLFLNVEYTLNYLFKKGAKPEKTVLGVPLYGRSFSLMNPHDHYMGSKAKTTSFQGPYTREDGFLGYNEICEEQMEQEWCPKRVSQSVVVSKAIQHATPGHTCPCPVSTSGKFASNRAEIARKHVYNSNTRNVITPLASLGCRLLRPSCVWQLSIAMKGYLSESIR